MLGAGGAGVFASCHSGLSPIFPQQLYIVAIQYHSTYAYQSQGEPSMARNDKLIAKLKAAKTMTWADL
jgi:hypothetical protein